MKNYHFRRIPDHIEQELRNVQSQHIVIATIVSASKLDIARRTYRHLGIRVDAGNLFFPDIITPDKLEGIYARRNRNGIVWIHKNLPKVIKTFSFDSPNFGDPSKGYHTTYIDREVYQRTFEPPRDWEIILSLIDQTEDRYRFRIQIHTLLDRQHPDFREDLFFAINLLQEQCRECHVFDAHITDEELAVQQKSVGKSFLKELWIGLSASSLPVCVILRHSVSVKYRSVPVFCPDFILLNILSVAA